MKLQQIKKEMIDLLNSLEGWDLVEVNNAFCQSAQYQDDEYYQFDDEFFQMFFENRVIDAVRATFFGNIRNWNDEFIYFDGYGNLVSTNNPEFIETISNIVDHICENSEDYEGVNDDLDNLIEELNSL